MPSVIMKQLIKKEWKPQKELQTTANVIYGVVQKTFFGNDANFHSSINYYTGHLCLLYYSAVTKRPFINIFFRILM